MSHSMKSPTFCDFVFCILCCLLVLSTFVPQTKAQQKASFEWEDARNHLDSVKQSLMNSSWPADHGDVARSKYTLGAGLPKYFDPSKLRVHTQTELKHAQWMYTYGNNSEWLYLISGPHGDFYMSKVNSTSLEIVQQIPLAPSIYMGGLLMHASGHVFCIHANMLYRFWQGDLYNVSKIVLPTDLNGRVVQTNGLLVTSDGYLVAKQWSFNLEDSLYLAGIKNYIILLVVATILSFFFLAIYYFAQKKNGHSTTTPELLKVLLLSIAIVFPTVLCVFTVMIVGGIVGRDFSSWKFLTNNILFANGGGGSEIKIIDPFSMETVAGLKLSERCSFPRLAMTYVKNEVSGESEDAIVVVGDENVYQVRWTPSKKELYMIPSWTRRYRKRWEGSFPGTGPAIFNNTAYFTDNTYTGYLHGRTFKMFKRDITLPASAKDKALSNEHSLTTLATGSGDYERIEGVHLTDEAPGFLFFSSVISPIEGDVVVWDAASRSVQARRLGNDDLPLHWKATARNMDCLMVAADKGHVYLSDYSDGPVDANKFPDEVAPKGNAKFTKLDKFFVVLNATTGEVLANVTIAENQKITAMMVIAGQNNDVFMGSSKGLTRIYIEHDKIDEQSTTESQQEVEIEVQTSGN